MSFLFSILLMLLSTCSSPRQKLYLFCWAEYINPSVIHKFEEKYQCDVILDTFDSNESMYAKLKAGASGYDVIVPSHYFIELLQGSNLIERLDISRIPNLKYIDKSTLERLGYQQSEYAVPFLYSFTAIGYRKDSLPNLSPTWDVFGRQDLKGRMTMLNDVREVFGAALKFLGYSANSINPLEIEEATKVLIKWKKNLAKFESEQYKNGIASREFLVVQGFKDTLVQVSNEDPEVGILIPIEGTMFTIDVMAILKNAPHPDLAYAFIDFILDPENALENMLYSCSTSPNTGTYQLLPRDILENPNFFPPQKIIEKSDLFQQLGPALSLYNDAWDKVKEN